MDADLLLNGVDGYEFNEAHPMAEEIERLAWRFSGVRREHPDTYYSRRDFFDGGDEDYHYKRIVPKTLQRGMPVPPALRVATGPDMVMARDTCDWLGRQSVLLRWFERDSRDVYSLWSNERLRDLIHQTQDLGGAVRAAHVTLESECGSDTQGTDNPFEIRVSGYAWTRATYLVSAEARDVLRVIGLLERAMRVGHRVNQLRSNALYGLNNINYGGRDGDIFDHHLNDALQAEQEADQLWKDPSHGPWHNFGGTPQPEDVGTAGDQIMAVRLRRAAQCLAAQVAKMAEVSCIQKWADDNHDESQKLPLVTEIPNHVLCAIRDWPPERPTAGSGKFKR